MTLDVIVICVFLLAVVLGYKIGFLNYVVKIASIFTGILLTVVVINPVHGLVMDSSLGQAEITYYEEKIISSDFYQESEGELELEDLLIDIGIPGLVSGVISSLLLIDSTSDDFAISLATMAANLSIWIKCFVILVVFTSIIIYLIKIFIKKIRTFKFIKLIDGMFGIGISLALSILCGYVMLSIVAILTNGEMFSTFGTFMDNQYEESLGIYKYFYNNNFVYAFFELLFG